MNTNHAEGPTPSQALAVKDALDTIREKESIQKEQVKVSSMVGSDKKRDVYRAKSGMFAKKPKPPTVKQVQDATAQLLTQVSSDKPKSEWEQMTEAMIELAKNPTEKTASASVKAYEALQKASGFTVKPEENSRITQIIFTMPNLPLQGELQPREPLKPPAFLQAEFETDAPKQMTASELQRDHGE